MNVTDSDKKGRPQIVGRDSKEEEGRGKSI